MGNSMSKMVENIKEIYSSRSILYSLIIKNLVGRYKNSMLGFTWNFIVPIILMGVYYVVFTQIRTSYLPYFWIFISSAVFPFNFMTSNLIGGSNCIVSNSQLIKKMYFPREIIVLSQVISSLIVMLIGYGVVLILVAISGYGISIAILLMPVLIIALMTFVIGYTLLFSSLTVYVRDIHLFLNSISMVFFFMTPMYFVADSVGGTLGTIIWFNPFTYYVECFHEIVYYKTFPSIEYLTICMLLSTTLLIVGSLVFSKLKKGFVERL